MGEVDANLGEVDEVDANLGEVDSSTKSGRLRMFPSSTWRCGVRYACIAVVAVATFLFSTGQVVAQYGPEEIGAEESPIVDPDTETDESGLELEEVEAMDGKEVEPEEPEDNRKGRGCAVDPSSSIPSEAPIEALLFAGGLVAFRRLWTAR